MTFLCDFIKRSVIYVLRVKSDTFEAFKHFQLHNEHENNRVRRFRTNWKKRILKQRVRWLSLRARHWVKVNRIRDFRAKWNRWTLKANHHVNDQHHASKRRFKRQMMNRVNQNNQLSSKSLFDDKQINHFLWDKHEKKIIFRSSSSNRNNELRYETQISHEMKKACSQIVLRCARKIRKKSHLSNVTLQRNHLSCFVCHLNQEKARKITFRWDFR